jgi:HD-GYP domain-containing protein (c-di-GMP phosphodiesterase class II)
MRFVSKGSLETGMVLARTLYGKNDNVLLKSNTQLTDSYIRLINQLSIPGIYISDDISSDIDVKSTISEELRVETLKKVKKLFLTNRTDTPQTISILGQVESIIEELIANKDVMLNVFDFKRFDNYTYAHSVNVALISLIIGIALELNKKELTELGFAALIHDIGKMLIDKEIVNKAAQLTAEEFVEIQKHPLMGYKYARETYKKMPETVFQAILDHHEKYDGTGYPHRKAGNDISLYGRILALADVYDAISAERPYRKALSPSESMEYIMGNAGTHFDPLIANLFIHKIAPYPVGTMVHLSNGLTGIVVENYEGNGMRPRVRVVKTRHMPVQPFDLDLSCDKRLLCVTVAGLAQD